MIIAETGAKNGRLVADELRGEQPGDRRGERGLQDGARRMAQPVRARARGRARTLGGLLDERLGALGEGQSLRLGHPT